MSEYAVMPMQDYINACKIVRDKTLSQNPIKSADLSKEILNVYETAKADFGNKQIVTGENRVTAEYVEKTPHNVPVKLSSKEFISFPYFHEGGNNGSFITKVNEDESVTLNGRGYIQFCFTNPNPSERMVLPSGSYALNGIPENFNEFKVNLEAVDNSDERFVLSGNTNFTIDTPHYIRVMIDATSTEVTYDNVTLRPSIKRIDINEILLTRYGENETDSPQTYTVNDDGTVDGVTSLSPIMNLVVDTEGVLIEAEYYEDIKAEQARFWDSYQKNGERTDYSSAFEGEGWNNQNFKPMYDIKPTKCSKLFNYSKVSGDLVQILDDLGIVLDTSGATEITSCFSFTDLTHIGEVSFESIKGLSQCFRSSEKLEAIDLIKLKSDGTNSFSNTFYECYSLKNITFSGVIGNNILFSHSTLLSAESIRNIVEHLSDTATSKTLTLSKTAVNKAFTTDEWQNLMDTKPNWSFSLV